MIVGFFLAGLLPDPLGKPAHLPEVVNLREISRRRRNLVDMDRTAICASIASCCSKEGRTAFTHSKRRSKEPRVSLSA